MKLTQFSPLYVLVAAVAISVALFFGANVAKADVITDTGSTGPVTGNSASLYSSQWLAAEFTLPASATITDVSGWIYSGFDGPYFNGYYDYGSGGDLTFAIYTSSNSVYNSFNPVPANMIYSTTVNVATNAPLGWIGPTGLNWSLPPGKYWVAFEVQAGSLFNGSMPGSSSSSVPTEGIDNPYYPTSHWFGPTGTSQNLGVQIYGTVGSVSAIPLNIQSISNTVVLSWNDPASVFVLQAAPTVNGIFTNIPSASSPYTNAITNPQQYFQLVYPAN
jgi:hypothetical protein